MTGTEQVADAIPHTSLDGKPRNIQLQWVRGTAALLVLLYHASLYQRTGQPYQGWLTIFDTRFAFFGVSLFFVLSGYLMANAIALQRPVVFLAHRIVRIYPAFLLICAATYLAHFLLGDPLPVDFRALSLAPAGSPFASSPLPPAAIPHYPLGPEWTLVFELGFYAALFLVGLAGAGEKIRWIAAAWLVLLAVTSWHRTTDFLLLGILDSSEDAALAAGLLIPSLLRLRPPPVPCIALGVIAWFAGYDFLAGNDPACRWLAGLAATLVVAGMIELSRRRPSFGDNRLGRSLSRFGDHSYVLYLYHLPIIYLVYGQLHGVPFPVLWALVVVLCLLIAPFAGRLDLALYRVMKRMVNQARPRFVAIGVAFYLAGYLAVALVQYHAIHQRQARQRLTDELGQLLAGTGTISSAGDATALGLKAGFHPDSALTGGVDSLDWTQAGLVVRGWAIDLGKHGEEVSVALFQDGTLLGSAAGEWPRPDISGHFGTGKYSGFAASSTTACKPGKPVVIVEFTADKRFAILPNRLPAPACP